MSNILCYINEKTYFQKNLHICTLLEINDLFLKNNISQAGLLYSNKDSFLKNFISILILKNYININYLQEKYIKGEVT